MIRANSDVNSVQFGTGIHHLPKEHFTKRSAPIRKSSYNQEFEGCDINNNSVRIIFLKIKWLRDFLTPPFSCQFTIKPDLALFSSMEPNFTLGNSIAKFS